MGASRPPRSLVSCLPSVSDHCGSGGDAEEGARAGGSPKEAGSHPTAAVQVLTHRAEGG